MPHTGFENTSVPSLEEAIRQILEIIRQPKTLRFDYKARNQRILTRYEAGETLQELANAYGVSYQRIHQIVDQERQ